MNNRERIAAAIRDALDERGIELTWSDIYPAAEAVEDAMSDVIEDAWRYSELSD